MMVWDKITLATTKSVTTCSITLTLIVVLCVALMALPFGHYTNFFTLPPQLPKNRQEWQHTILLCLRLWFLPCTFEEYLWRVLMQPYPTTTLLCNSDDDSSTLSLSSSATLPETTTTITTTNNNATTTSASLSSLSTWDTWIIVLSIAAYVLFHPIAAYTFWPRGRAIFGNIRFLCLTTLLGIGCTMAYQGTGSVWMPLLVHWLAVVGWIAFLGGEQQLLSSFTAATATTTEQQQPISSSSSACSIIQAAASGNIISNTSDEQQDLNSENKGK